MTITLREAMARAILMEGAPHIDAWNVAGEDGRRRALDSADAALLAIDLAGYAVVPRDADIRLTDAGHVVHEVRGAPNDVWHSLLAAVLAASPPLTEETATEKEQP